MTRKTEIAAAREADTLIAAAWTEAHKVQDQFSAALKSIEYKKDNLKRLAGYSQSAMVTGRIEREEAELAEAEKKAEAIRVEYNNLRNAAIQLDKDLYTGWSRFFLVKHIHSNQHCSSFRMTTRVAWLPNVSGLTEAEAVAAHGETLCTICYPSAPTELTTKQADLAICTGRPDFNQQYRSGYYSGNWAICTDCGTRQTLTTAGNLRKHKK